ncbi:MAG: hypothetical protein WKF96_07225 [Solirubrobacteraceae bacterium]
MLRFRLPVIALLAVVAVPGAAIADELLDHPAPPAQPSTAPPSPAFQAGGPNAKWESMGTVFTGNPHTDLDYFESKGETFAAVGTLAAGANGGGVTFVKLIGKDGKIAPQFAKAHPSASCVTDASRALSLQHDIEATPKPANSLLNTANDKAKLGDAQLILDATDASGRCHDQGIAGFAMTARGGIEIIDVSEGVDQAKEIGLTRHIGEAHTVNIDPKRPHIAYAVTSDSIGVDEKGVRNNENENGVVNAAGQTSTSFGLDGFEVVDLSSCMNFPVGTTLAQKRDACRPQVFRYRYPSAAFAQGFAADDTSDAFRGIFGCHELEVYADDRLTCGSGAASILFDMSGAFDDMGTPADFTDDKPRGTPLPCARRDSSTPAGSPFATGAKATDCVTGTQDGTDVDLRVPFWKKIGSPSLEGVEHIGTARHIGRAGTGQRAKVDSTQDIDFSHESELSHSGRYLISTDERGGGVLPPGAACDTADEIKEGNGGVHFYATDRLQKEYSGNADETQQAYARTSKGAKAIYRVPIRTGAQATICTAHVLQQIPGQNRIFMGWYSQGTQVFDYTENADGTVDFKEAGFFIPASANEWVSSIYKVEKNQDGTFTYFGATGDFSVGQGRNAIDLYKVTLPPPPSPRIDASEAAPAAQGPAPSFAPTSGSGGSGSGGGATGCTATNGLRNATARPRRGGALRFAFEGNRAIDVEVFRLTRADRILRARSIKKFSNRTSAFTWKARGVRNGTYVARYRVRGNQGRSLAQRVAVQRKRGRFFRLPPIERRATCDEVERLALTRPVFGGRKGYPLKLAVRVTEEGTTVGMALLRDGKVVRKRSKSVTADRTVRIPIGAKGLADGRYTVRVTLRFARAFETVTLGARKL